MDQKSAILERLEKLLSSQFSEVIFRLEQLYPRIGKKIPTPVAPITQQASAIIEILKEKEDGLEQLVSIIDKVAPRSRKAD